MQEYHPIKYFSPSWFAMIMGTGGVANVLYLWSNGYTIVNVLAKAIAFIALVAWLLAIIPWVLRWVLYYDYANRDLNHPLTGNFFVTMPIGTVIIGTNVSLIWSQYLNASVCYTIMLVIWLFAVFGVSFFSFHTTFRVIRVDNTPKPEMVNFSWIMSPIANMAILLIGNPLLTKTITYRPEWALNIFVVNTMLFGIGFLLFIFFSAIIFVRLAFHALPPADTTPSFGIFFGAIGLLVSAIVDGTNNALNMGLLTSTGLANLIALSIWGFGIWIFVIILAICIHQTRKNGIPFSLAWWAFIFPLAAYILAGQKIAQVFVSSLVNGYIILLMAVLMTLWLYAFANSLRGIWSKKLFMGTPIRIEVPPLEVQSISQLKR